ncbi:hypothetical protein ACU4HD_46010 [Cupriavidus basilensis]
MEIGQQIGLCRSRACLFPNHFLVRMEHSGTKQTGRARSAGRGQTLSKEELQDMPDPYPRRRGGRIEDRELAGKAARGSSC